MSIGSSFRQAYQSSSAEFDRYFSKKMEFLFRFVAFPQQLIDKSMAVSDQQLVFELRFVDQSRHKTIERLKTLRDRYAMEAEFRRRSGRILQQVRLQAVILVGLYFALFMFVMMNFAVEGLYLMLGCSVLLLATGVGLLFKLGRTIKWRL